MPMPLAAQRVRRVRPRRVAVLGKFVDVVQTVGVKNFLVVALDERTVDFLNRKKCPNYLRKLRSRTGSTDNHATSGLKFQILYEMLSVGVSVLLSDVDVRAATAATAAVGPLPGDGSPGDGSRLISPRADRDHAESLPRALPRLGRRGHVRRLGRAHRVRPHA